tara:strand:- start:701 stop:928 length:228 start_codon:yes stop_codon:yes gene_type:complete
METSIIIVITAIITGAVFSFITVKVANQYNIKSVNKAPRLNNQPTKQDNSKGVVMDDEFHIEDENNKNIIKEYRL